MLYIFAMVNQEVSKNEMLQYDEELILNGKKK